MFIFSRYSLMLGGHDGFIFVKASFLVEGSDGMPAHPRVVHFAHAGQVKDSSEKLTPAQLGDYYTKLASEFPIVSIEDGFDQVCEELARARARISRYLVDVGSGWRAGQGSEGCVDLGACEGRFRTMGINLDL